MIWKGGDNTPFWTMEEWDDLGLSTDTLDSAQCILPDQSHVHAAPNGFRFILRLTEHAAIHVKPLSCKGRDYPSNFDVW